MTTRTTTAYVKLGGALITDKAGREAVRAETLRRAAREIAGAWEAGVSLIVGHGSGSFGHAAAADEGFRGGSLAPLAAARVAAAARRLNAIVVDELVACGLPALGFPGSALVRGAEPTGEAGTEAVLESGGAPIMTALAAGFLPVIYGDMVPTSAGGSICSTEALFVALLNVLPASRVVLATDVDGVLDASGQLVHRVPAGGGDGPLLASGGREGVRDVTGGMAAKVRSARAMIQVCPEATVVILNGMVAGRIRDGLTGTAVTGTVIGGSPRAVAS